MQTVSAPPPKAPKPTPENVGISEGLKRRDLHNNGVLEKLSQNMSENIIHPFANQLEMVESESRVNENQEMLAGELASAVVEVALKEVCTVQRMGQHHQNSKSAALKTGLGVAKNPAFMYDLDSDEDFLDSEITQGEDIQTSKDTQTFHPPLSQSGLPIVGSLDYPDAPPTTPLLPELKRSRNSFAKKLKGGLAMVFMPSPPPTTPKDLENGAIRDPRAELMDHLMHSLSMDDLARGYCETGSHVGSKMEAFAEALSCDIIDRVFGEEMAVADGDLHLLAHQLAKTILTSSIDEAKMQL